MSSLALLAGNVGGCGSADGVGSAGRFSSPSGLAIDASGNLYIADYGNLKIRKVTPGGAVTTLDTAAAEFLGPRGVAVDSAGNVYVADSYTVRKVTPAGVVTTLAGDASGNQCGGGAVNPSPICYLQGIAVDASGNVFVSSMTSPTIQRISPAGFVATLAGSGLTGTNDGPGVVATFGSLQGLAVDATGAVLAADSQDSYLVRRVAPDGTTTTVAGTAGVSGWQDGPAATAKFSFPMGVGVDGSGNVYVTDSGYQGHGQTVRRITPAGVVSTLAGTPGQFGSADGVGGSARFNGPGGVAIDVTGNVYVADSGNCTIRKVTPAGAVTTFAGLAAVRGVADGTGATATFTEPQGLAVDARGDVYVANGGSNVVQSTSGTIRRVSAAGVVTTIAGDGSAPAASTDGVGSAARFILPQGIAVDHAGDLIVSDASCPPPPPVPNTHGPPPPPCFGTIRRVTTAGVVTTIAGTPGVSGATDGLGPSASFGRPVGIALDSTGNIFVADQDAHTIRKIDAAGMVTTFAGTAFQSGDANGTGAAARFSRPSQLTIDAAGNLYVKDGYSTRVRRITPNGVVTTVLQGDTQHHHEGLAIDTQGNLYLGDPVASVIRKWDTTGALSTVVGVEGQSSFVPGMLPGRIAQPSWLTIRGRELYFTLGNGVAVVHELP